MSFVTFLLGLALGALYAPLVKPLVLAAWKRIKEFVNKTPHDPIP